MRRLIPLLVIALLLTVSQVFAVGVGAIGASITSCDPFSADLLVVGVHEGPAAQDDIGNIDLYDGDGTHVAHLSFTLLAGSNITAMNFTVTSWMATPQANPMRMVVSDADTGAIAWDYPFTASCITRTNNTPVVSYASDGMQIALIEDEEGAFGFSLIGIDLDGESGFPVVTMTAADLAALPEEVEENTLIAEGEQTTFWGEVAVYQLTTGEIQVNVGPDAEGKVRVTIYDAIPPTSVYGYDFSIYDVGDEGE